MTAEPLGALAQEVRDRGGLMAEAVAGPAPGAAAPLGEAAAAGERTRDRGADYALLVEAIREGYEQHYGEGRVVRSEDPDLALLAGDRLYALGLARLAALGDLEAVAELADVISLGAQAHAEGRPAMAEAAWASGVAAVAAGSTPSHESDKVAWRNGAARAQERHLSAPRTVR
jgi:hypothetical protein